MKTMEILCTRFSRIHPGYTAELLYCEMGRYFIYIDCPGNPAFIGYRTFFDTCKEFSEWMHGVIMD